MEIGIHFWVVPSLEEHLPLIIREVRKRFRLSEESRQVDRTSAFVVWRTGWPNTYEVRIVDYANHGNFHVSVDTRLTGNSVHQEGSDHQILPIMVVTLLEMSMEEDKRALDELLGVPVA